MSGQLRKESVVAVKPDIFTYLEYRLFIKDAFNELKKNSLKLSYRTFAKTAGFSSPNFLQMVILGKRNLNSTYTIATAKAFKLNKQETEFFQNLVGYDQAKSFDEKNLFYQKILKNKRYAIIKTLDKSQYEFFSQWYLPVVRELLTHENYGGNDSWLADKIFPRITVAQVENAKNLLLKLGLVVYDEKSQKWSSVDAILSTDSESSYLALRNYHKASIQLAQNALEHFGPEQRDVRSVTLGLPKSAYKELKSRLENFWVELMDFAGAQQKTDEVYQVNLQLFPLTKERKL